MITKITNGKVIIDNEITIGKSIYIENGKIKAITSRQINCDKTIDARGLYVSTGFIDLHLHGGLGYDFADGDSDAVVKIANYHCQHGATTIFPTTLSASYQEIVKSLSAIKTAMDSGDIIPNIGGVHLEGPYFSLKQSGAQNPKFITPPVKKDYMNVLKKYGDIIKRWSFAPELDGTKEFVTALNKSGVVGSIGHSDAKYDEAMSVYDMGVKLITHFYSCISTITREKGFRKLGLTEFGYMHDDVFVEAIADGCHIHVDLFKLLYKIKGQNSICLVTDAMRCSGIDEEFSEIGGIPCKIKNGVACLMDESAFAGSIATADRLVRFCIKEVGIDICSALKMITINPANAMGLVDKGRLAEGYDADLVFFDEDITVKKVIVNGNEI